MIGDSISFVENDDIKNKVEIILRQTDYTEEKAREKLQFFNYDYILVIKDFLGIAEKKAPRIVSVNQEIYKQLRYKMDSSMREYTEKKSS
jgi:hypothetical protein